ncbi:MAG: hypothetical protein SVZ03_06460 [Spirochaetota bacterium]|nr:hypothetical protein [Spirochaetota bacterium]
MRKKIHQSTLVFIIIAHMFYYNGNEIYGQTDIPNKNEHDTKIKKTEISDVEPTLKDNQVDSVDNEVKAENPPTQKETQSSEKKERGKEEEVIKDIEDKTDVDLKVKAEAPRDKNKKRNNQIKDYGLLEVIEGEFKYKRIPGYKTSDKTDTEILSQDRLQSHPIDNESLTPKGDGLDDTKKNNFDTLITIALILIVALIFILYRIRSKERSRGSVLKRFPKG